MTYKQSRLFCTMLRKRLACSFHRSAFFCRPIVIFRAIARSDRLCPAKWLCPSKVVVSLDVYTDISILLKPYWHPT